MKILIRKRKMEICWSILRHFGYQNDLRIRQSLWDDQTIENSELANARSFELKRNAIEFLGKLYHNDTYKGVFDQSSVERIFKSSPFECPWQI